MYAFGFLTVAFWSEEFFKETYFFDLFLPDPGSAPGLI